MNPAAGKRLRSFVERHRAPDGTWEDFARAVGVTKSGLFRWFAGNEPSMGALRGLAAVLEVPRWELVKEWDGESCTNDRDPKVGSSVASPSR